MVSFERYQTRVVEDPNDVPATPDEGLRVSGWTMLPAYFVRLARDPERDLESAFGWNPQDSTYTGALWPEHPVRAVAPHPVGMLRSELAVAARIEPGPLRLAPIWLDDRHLLVLVVLTVRCRDDFSIDHLQSHSSRFDDMLAALRVLRSEQAVADQRDAVRDWVSATLGADAVQDVRPVQDGLGLELWDLRGSDREDGAYSGIVESRRFAWQLAALKGHGVRHILEHGRWREQRHEQVVNEVRSGYTYLNDHLTLVNATSCLEVVHDPGPHMIPSVHDRLQRWGFNSSALFVWSVELLRGLIARDLVADYDSRLLTLLDRTGMSAGAHADIVRDLLGDSAVVQVLATLPRQWREDRHRGLQAEVSSLRGHDADLDRLREALDRTGGLARDLRSVDAQTRATRSSIMLAAFAAALAAVGLPQLVGILSDFRADGATGKLWTSVALVVVVLGAAVWLTVSELRRGAIRQQS